MNNRVVQPLNIPKRSDAGEKRGARNKKSDQDGSKAHSPDGQNHGGENTVNYFTYVSNFISAQWFYGHFIINKTKF